MNQSIDNGLRFDFIEALRVRELFAVGALFVLLATLAGYHGACDI